MNPTIVMGIDIGQETLVCATGTSGLTHTYLNGPAGHARLVRWAQQQAVGLVVLEATGGYHLGIWEALDDAGIGVAVCHPNRMRSWMKGQGQRAKTDAIDATQLARYGQQEQPLPTPLPRQAVRTVAALLDRRQQLVKQQTAEKNRRQQTELPALHASIDALLTVLGQLIADLDDQVWDCVQADEELRRLVERLCTVPGIGRVTAMRLAVELPELGQVSAKQLAALVGVAPLDRQSGRYRGTAHIGGGRASLRHALYLPIIATIRCDPTFHAHYDQLRSRGKPVKVARIACVRKLLGILTAMVRDDLTWEQTQVGQGVFVAATA